MHKVALLQDVRSVLRRLRANSEQLAGFLSEELDEVYDIMERLQQKAHYIGNLLELCMTPKVKKKNT